MKRRRVIRVTTVLPTSSLPGAAAKTLVKSMVPKVTKIRKMARRKPKSPIRLTMKAFLPASEADFFSYQNPIRK